MKAIRFEGQGKSAIPVLCDAKIPDVASQEILVRVHAAGVNRADLLQMKGLYPVPDGISDIPGLEIAGVVEKVGGDVKDFKVGDNVCALVEAGAYAEYCAADSRAAFHVPEGMSFEDAASLPESIFTCWLNLVMIGGLKKNESVLIHGGGSGIGTMAIQIGRMLGANVFVTAGSDEKCEKCIQLGAHHAINYNKGDFAREILPLTASIGVDVILDIVGRDYLEQNISLLKKYGRLVIIALMSGRSAQIDLGKVLMKNLIVTASTLRFRTTEEKAAIASGIRGKVWPTVGKEGGVKPVIDTVFALSDVQKAFERMENRFNFGKIVLKVPT